MYKLFHSREATAALI